MAEKNHGFARIVNACFYSYKGCLSAWRNEAAFRQEIVAFAILLPVACWLDVSTVERLLLISSLVLVVIIELVNSAIEAVVDRISDELHELAGRAKDMGSAAVMVSILLSIAIWLSILWPKIVG